MKNLRTRLFLLAASLLTLGSARAAFDPAIVSSDARWTVYVDLESLRASTLGKEIVAAAEKAQLESNKMPLGIDLQKVFKTIGNVTAYGTSFSTDPGSVDGSLVIQGTADLRKIAEAALVQATITKPDQVKDVTGLPFPVYAIFPNATAPKADDATTGAKPDQKPAPGLEVFVAFPPEGAIFVSKSQEQLLKAREIFLGHAPSLAKNPDSPLASLISNAHSAYLFAASAVPSDAALPAMEPTQSRILKMTRAGSFSLGENGPLTFLHAELLASSDEMADKLVKILQGMTAMVSLTESNDKDLTDFLNSATVVRNDQTVTLNLAYASAKLSDMIQNVQKAATSTATANIMSNMGNHTTRDFRLSYGKLVSEWNAVSEPVAAGAPPAPDTLAWQTVENVHLTPASLITLTGRSAGRTIAGRSVCFDRVEISPSQGGGAPLIFRGEYMKLIGGFMVERTASPLTGGKPITARTPVCAAQFQFPAGEGSYTIRVAYINNHPTEGTSYGLSVKDLSAPDAPAAEAKPNDDAAKKSSTP